MQSCGIAGAWQSTNAVPIRGSEALLMAIRIELDELPAADVLWRRLFSDSRKSKEVKAQNRPKVCMPQALHSSFCHRTIARDA
jgi:hypothetical protein